MPNLSRPGFIIHPLIDPVTGNSYQSEVTALVDVELTPSDMALIQSGRPLTLESSFWGDDGQFNGGDDFLFLFTPQNITESRTYTFKQVVYSSVFNEDNSFFDDQDEIYDRFIVTTPRRLLGGFGPIVDWTLTAITTPVLELYV
jgi:hypothetical protein